MICHDVPGATWNSQLEPRCYYAHINQRNFVVHPQFNRWKSEGSYSNMVPAWSSAVYIMHSVYQEDVYHRSKFIGVEPIALNRAQIQTP